MIHKTAACKLEVETLYCQLFYVSTTSMLNLFSRMETEEKGIALHQITENGALEPLL